MSKILRFVDSPTIQKSIYHEKERMFLQIKKLIHYVLRDINWQKRFSAKVNFKFQQISQLIAK